MHKRKLKYVAQFEEEMLLGFQQAFVETMLEHISFSDAYHRPTLSSLMKAMTEKIQPNTFIVKACLRQFVIDKYERLVK